MLSGGGRIYGYNQRNAPFTDMLTLGWAIKGCVATEVKYWSLLLVGMLSTLEYHLSTFEMLPTAIPKDFRALPQAFHVLYKRSFFGCSWARTQLSGLLDQTDTSSKHRHSGRGRIHGSNHWHAPYMEMLTEGCVQHKARWDITSVLFYAWRLPYMPQALLSFWVL